MGEWGCMTFDINGGMYDSFWRVTFYSDFAMLTAHNWKCASNMEITQIKYHQTTIQFLSGYEKFRIMMQVNFYSWKIRGSLIWKKRNSLGLRKRKAVKLETKFFVLSNFFRLYAADYYDVMLTQAYSPLIFHTASSTSNSVHNSMQIERWW